MKRIRLDIYKCNEEYTIEKLQKIVKTNFESKGIEMKNYKRSEQSGTDIFNFDFYFGCKNVGNRQIPWYEEMKNLFELEEIDKNTFSAYGILIIEAKINQFEDGIEDLKVKKNPIYMLTFAHGGNIVGPCIEPNFGLEMASRIAKKDAINAQSSKFFSIVKNKSLVVYDNANFNTQVGEAVDYLVADIEEQSGRNAINQLLKLIEVNMNFSSNISVILKEEFNTENLISTIRNIDNIYNTYKERVKIPKLHYLKPGKDKEIIDKLYKKLTKDTIDLDNTKISFGLYTVANGKIHLLNEDDTCEIYVNRKKEIYDELNLENVRDFMKKYDIKDITKIKTKIGTKSLELHKLIDYTTILEKENEYYCLSNGACTLFNDNYVKKVKEEITDKINNIVEYKSEYNLVDLEKLAEKYDNSEEEKSDVSYQERIYNKFLCDKMHADLMDRELLDYLEIADLYEPDEKQLIHVKIGEAGKLVECVNQSSRGAEYYKHNVDIVKSKFTKIKGVKTITLFFVINTKSVWNSKDFNKFKSLKLKLGLIEWYNNVQELGYTPKIIVAKNMRDMSK